MYTLVHKDLSWMLSCQYSQYSLLLMPVICMALISLAALGQGKWKSQEVMFSLPLSFHTFHKELKS